MGGLPTTQSLKIKLFGSMEVAVCGEPLPKLRSRSELWLLALLALQQGRPVTRRWLTQSLWPFPDHAADRAAYNLRRALTNLRKALGAESGRLHSPRPGTICLDLRDAVVDTAAFAERIAMGDPLSLEAAVNLYTGRLLLECTELWAAVERAKYEQQYLHCLRQLSDRAAIAGDGEAAVGYLRRAIAVDPSCEPAQRSLMEALSARGDIPAALQVYQEYCTAVNRDRNAYPAAETTASHVPTES